MGFGWQMGWKLRGSFTFAVYGIMGLVDVVNGGLSGLNLSGTYL